MADALYAWSEIRIGKHEEGANSGETTVIKPGDTVTQGDLSDEQFEQLASSGAVKSMKYPEMPEEFQGSPVDFLRQQAKMAADDALMEAETSEANMTAIMAANAASTGGTMPEPAAEPTKAEAAKAAGGDK